MNSEIVKTALLSPIMIIIGLTLGFILLRFQGD